MGTLSLFFFIPCALNITYGSHIDDDQNMTLLPQINNASMISDAKNDYFRSNFCKQLFCFSEMLNFFLSSSEDIFTCILNMFPVISVCSFYPRSSISSLPPALFSVLSKRVLPLG